MKQYARGAYNKFNDKEQWIRLSEGCPNNCEFCRETKERRIANVESTINLSRMGLTLN